ncbi:MAG TPA: metalloregulator ArsR/SmtB family transcription factor [Fimbriimonadaceae bacterium]|nr:metalloregulator ArsR/SmtB family transcription factor [Fimbriimonadaceae bacterium]
MAVPAAIYQALGDPTRLAMVERLGERGPLPTLELVEGLGMTRQAATKHLLVLENVGLVESRTEGRQVLRQLRLEVLQEASDWLTKRSRLWDQKLDALRRLVEEG